MLAISASSAAALAPTPAAHPQLSQKRDLAPELPSYACAPTHPASSAAAFAATPATHSLFSHENDIVPELPSCACALTHPASSAAALAATPAAHYLPRLDRRLRLWPP
jgi:hypothetical protein